MRITVMAGVVLLVATACTTSGKSTAFPSVTASSPTTTPTASSPTPIADDPGPYMPRGLYGDGPGFMTPSGNVACTLTSANDHAGVDCVIRVQAWRVPPCARRTYPDVSLYADGGPGVTCNYWPPGGPFRTLPYGHSLNDMQITCVSRATGVTCTNGTHGFTVSREADTSF